MKAITTDSIHINLNSDEWKLTKDSTLEKTWTNGYGGYIGITIFQEEPDYPKDADVYTLRHIHRDVVSSAKGAILEVDMDEINSLPAVKTLFKFPQDPTGFIYVATYLIPRKGFFFTLKTQFLEVGTTGIRESVLLIVTEKEGLVKKGTFEGWFSDPYDPDAEGLIANLGDREVYDDKFPNHPLSLSRKKLKEIKENVEFDTEIMNSEPHFTDF